jgi:hypothetical protein
MRKLQRKPVDDDSDDALGKDEFRGRPRKANWKPATRS